MTEKTTTVNLETIAEWLEKHYNKYLTTYIYDDSDYVRLTNGSAAFYIDIYIANGQSFAIEGEKYGKTINTSCDATQDALFETLSGRI